MSTLTLGGYDLEAFARRILADCISEATVQGWERRAQAFEAAAHRPGIDYPGQATDGQLQLQRDRCRMTALACRQKAALLDAGWIDAA